MLASTVQFSSYERPPPTTRRLPTTPPHTTAHKHHSTETRGRPAVHRGTVPKRPDPTARSLRTQQRAKHPPPPTGPFPPGTPPPTNGEGGARAVLGPAAAAG